MIAKVEQFVTAVNEAPSLSEVVARTVEEYAAKANPETKSGAALQSMSKVFTATAKVTSKPRRALVRGFIAGKPAAAVAEFQQDMDSGLKELKEATFSGIEAYEEGKFGDVPDPIMYPVDKVTGGKVSRFSRQVQGGLLKSLYTMGEGIVTIGVHPVRTIEGVAKIAEMVSPLPSPDTITNAVGFATDLVDPKLTAKDAAKRYLAAEEAEQQRRRTEMIALVKGLGENYLDAWKKERYGEIPGLLLGDVGSFFIGAGEARAATGAAKGAGTVGKLGDVAKLGEVGDVGKIAEGAKSLAPMAEGAKLAESAKGVEAAQLSKPALPKEIPAPIEPKTPAVPGLPGYRTPEVPPPVPDTPFFPAPEPRKPSIPPPEPKPVPAEPATPVPPEPRPVPPEPKTPVPPEPKVFPPTRRRRDPPPFRDWRDTLPANDNAIPTGSRPANDNAFAPKNAETAAQVEREVAEVAAVEEIPIKRAAGDFERHLPPGETLTTVDRPMAAASKRAAGQPLRTVGPTRPGGPGGPSATGRSLGGPARRPRRPAMPKEPPILPEGIRNRKITAREAIDFFEGNRRSYPAEIRQLIDDARRKPTKAAAVEIDSAVRNLYARRMNKALGYPDVGPRDQVIAPFRRSVKGTRRWRARAVSSKRSWKWGVTSGFLAESAGRDEVGPTARCRPLRSRHPYGAGDQNARCASGAEPSCASEDLRPDCPARRMDPRLGHALHLGIAQHRRPARAAAGSSGLRVMGTARNLRDPDPRHPRSARPRQPHSHHCDRVTSVLSFPVVLPFSLLAEGRTIPVAGVQAMHEGKRRAPPPRDMKRAAIAGGPKGLRPRWVRRWRYARASWVSAAGPRGAHAVR